MTADEELLVPLVFPPCWLKKLLLFCDDELDVELVLDDSEEDWVDWLAVVPTWCKATRPPNVPKPTIEATASHLLSVLASASARALGIFSFVLGL